MTYANLDPSQPPTERVVRFDAIPTAWRLAREKLGTWIPVAILYLIVIIVAGIISRRIVHSFLPTSRWGEPLYFISQNLASFFELPVAAFFRAGLYRMAIKQVRGEEISVGDLFSGGKNLGNFLLALMLIEVATTFIVLPSFIPALLLSGVEMFALPLVVDQDKSTFSAIKESWQILKKEWAFSTIFIILSVLASLSGLIVLVFGILFTFPISWLAVATIYCDYFGETKIAGPTLKMPLPPASAYVLPYKPTSPEV